MILKPKRVLLSCLFSLIFFPQTLFAAEKNDLMIKVNGEKETYSNEKEEVDIVVYHTFDQKLLDLTCSETSANTHVPCKETSEPNLTYTVRKYVKDAPDAGEVVVPKSEIVYPSSIEPETFTTVSNISLSVFKPGKYTLEVNAPLYQGESDPNNKVFFVFEVIPASDNKLDLKPDSITVNKGDTFDLQSIYTVSGYGEIDKTAAVTYSYENEKVAAESETEGTGVAKTAGTTSLTATFVDPMSHESYSDEIEVRVLSTPGSWSMTEEEKESCINDNVTCDPNKIFPANTRCSPPINSPYTINPAGQSIANSGDTNVVKMCIGRFPNYPSTEAEGGQGSFWMVKYRFFPMPLPAYVVENTEDPVLSSDKEQYKGLHQTYSLPEDPLNPDDPIKSRNAMWGKKPYNPERSTASPSTQIWRTYIYYPNQDTTDPEETAIRNALNITKPYMAGPHDFYHYLYRGRMFAKHVNFTFKVVGPKTGESGKFGDVEDIAATGSVYYDIPDGTATHGGLNCYDEEILDYKSEPSVCREIIFFLPNNNVDASGNAVLNLGENGKDTMTELSKRLTWKNPGNHKFEFHAKEEMGYRFQKDLGNEFQGSTSTHNPITDGGEGYGCGAKTEAAWYSMSMGPAVAMEDLYNYEKVTAAMNQRFNPVTEADHQGVGCGPVPTPYNPGVEYKISYDPEVERYTPGFEQGKNPDGRKDNFLNHCYVEYDGFRMANFDSYSATANTDIQPIFLMNQTGYAANQYHMMLCSHNHSNSYHYWLYFWSEPKWYNTSQTPS